MKLKHSILLLSDYDNTYSGSSIAKNEEAIEDFKAAGGLFTFCTGRLPKVLADIYPSFRKVANAPLVMCNGGIMFDPITGNTVEEHYFDGVQGRIDTRRLLDLFPYADWVVYPDDGRLVTDTPPEEVIGNRWRKMRFDFKEPALALRFLHYVEENYSDRYDPCRSFANWVEIMPKGISKADGLSWLRRYYRDRGIPDLLLYCIGDFDNDVPMLKVSDRPFCPSNATPEVISLCGGTLCHHNDGAVAELIRIILKEECE